MKTIFTAAAAVLALAAPAFAEGDAEVGEKDWKKCKACHAIVDPEGEVIEKGGKTGPNLWGIVGRQAGTDPEFGKYTDEIVALGEGGLMWTAEELAAYVPNAKEYIGAKTSMTPQKLKDPLDVVAFLAQYGAADEDAAEEESMDEESTEEESADGDAGEEEETDGEASE